MAYASIASLIRTMELLLTSDSPMLSLTFDHREEIIELHKKVSSIEAFLKNSEKQISDYRAMTELEARIKGFANVAEDKIEFGLREAMIAEDEMQRGKAHEELCESLQRVAKDIDRVQKESKKIQHHKGSQASTLSLLRDTSSSEKLPNLEVSNNMVGRDKEKKRMLEELKGGSKDELKGIPIVGMGGIGKTTLAKQVFNHPLIQSHFDARAWATISKEYNVKEILLSLLQSIINSDDKVYSRDETELADLLQKKLKCRRYLIVIDDIWSNKAWDDTKQCFPIDNNGSRILLTTRHTEVAIYASSSNLLLKMNLMNSDESWNLFKSKAFANKSFAPELETIGEKIASKCQGLPLTIVMVAGLLSKSKRTKKEWENVAENIKSFVTKDPDEQCLRVLGLSYNYLPNDLKACLLYFGIFPGDSEISVKRLVRLWIAEGFLKVEGDLEEEAENRLQDLVDRCLVLVSKRSADGRKIKTCRIHDLVHELCLREAQSQNFLFIRNDKTESVPRVGSRWISIQKSQQTDVEFQDEHWFRSLTHKLCWLIRTPTDDDKSPLRRIRSIFLYAAPSFSNNSNLELGHLNLIRVLDLSSMYFSSFPLQILSLFLLRYLSFSTRNSFGIPGGLCRLLNLQTFIVRGPVISFIKFPELIWETTQLRHLKLRNFYLPDPPSSSIDGETNLFWPNIQSVSGLFPYCCTKKILSRFQNIKKLCIRGHVCDYGVDEEDMDLCHLVDLHQLETLSIKVDRYQVSHWSSRFHKSPVYVPSAIHFPIKLKKLKLVGTRLSWEELNIIGQWPNLEVLKLKPNACRGLEWRPIGGRFPQLKFLLIEGTNLKCWKATNDHFPALEHLVIRHCFHLEEIPIEFADIYSLQLIELQNCTAKLLASTVLIQEEQESLGSKAVDVRSYNDSAECELNGSDSDSD
ncbi:putative late blight resistance protein homolog R1A-3 [Solanum stenotomum]|uniref:putative late blight resistance protein homolog R1A-3 n=1 Tax=Solanum stenotomum TaxID=172797 RepID=UPI0020D01379|nr:putative late blight resistance protein homolog R1A-3 [Solanum stenotomum]XP_049379575.1 putative late blight resistance protein homolog R1A-3 [Solanum stenotomum]XP_049379576.1 putative late blight resistance protein homolog R1A-3 [Solanum stenotomum]